MTQYKNRVLLHEVIDGDSVRVYLDLGFGSIHKCNARMDGVDAPEKNTEAGKLVKVVVEEWVRRRGSQLEFWSTAKPKYSGRAIGELYSVLAPDETLSKFLVNSGIAHRYDGAVKAGWGHTELTIIQEKCRELLLNN